MVNYKELGLVNTRDMFSRAVKSGWAVPAFNFNNLEQLQAIITASSELRSPVILQVSKGARKYANATLLRYMAEGAVQFAKELGCNHPEIVLHLDHGDSFELCKSCVDLGFSSVMIDGSSLPYEENIALTKKVVDYAHQYDVTVEGELGVLAGVEDEVAAEESHYTRPEEVIDFSTRSGVDSLAISIGTSHGAYKFKPEQCTRDPKTGRLVPPPLAFDILAEIEKQLPGFPIVLHGSSSVPQEYVDIINKVIFPMQSEYPRISFVRHQRAQFAKSTLTQTLALHLLPVYVKLSLFTPNISILASIVVRLANIWLNFTSTKSPMCLVLTTNSQTATNKFRNRDIKSGFASLRSLIFFVPAA